MPNCLDLVAAFYGTALLGAVVTPVNARYRSTELGYVVENADLVVLLTTDVARNTSTTGSCSTRPSPS